MMEIKTSELSGAALDWAVAMAICPESFKSDRLDSNGLYPWCTGWLERGSPSKDWSQGGPLIERHVFRMEGVGPHEWMACLPKPKGGQWLHEKGRTPLVATCRAIVSAKLGDTVTVPDELEG